MEILEDKPSYKIITRRIAPPCPDNIFPNEVDIYSRELNRFYNSYNYYITPECNDAIKYYNLFNVKRNVYYESLIFYNSHDNEPIPESLLSRIESISSVVLCLVNYNHPLDNLPISVRVLILELNPVLNSNSTSAIFEYIHSLNNLPINLEELILNVYYTGNLDYLPHNLKNLDCNNTTLSATLDNLPSGLLDLKVPQHYDRPLENLPQQLESLQIYYEYNHPLRHLPATLKDLDLGNNYYYDLVDLPVGLETLSLLSTPRTIKFPKNLKTLCIGLNCNMLISAVQSRIPVSLETIYCDSYNLDLVYELLRYDIPSKLSEIYISAYYSYCCEGDEIYKQKQIKKIKDSEQYKTLEDHLPADVNIIIQ